MTENPAATAQPLPAANKNIYVQTLVQQDIYDRLQFGIGKYGTGLQAFNGRDALEDAYQEALDLCCYLRQVIEEHRNPVDGEYTITCDTCLGGGFVQARQSTVSYVQNQPSICPTCDGNGWVFVEQPEE